jgi:hypothetical protein
MTFILSEDYRDEDVVAAFDKYRSYIENNKTYFPPSAYKLAVSDWYYNFSDHKCPHDAWLETLSIVEPSKGERNEIRKTEIKVKLLGAYQDGYIELNYRNVASFKIDAFNVKGGHSDWRYDEFRLSESGLLLHEIEWSGNKDTSKWLIEAEDIEYEWLDKKDT